MNELYFFFFLFRLNDRELHRTSHARQLCCNNPRNETKRKKSILFDDDDDGDLFAHLFYRKWLDFRSVCAPLASDKFINGSLLMLFRH